MRRPDAASAAHQQDDDSAYDVARAYNRSDSSASSNSDEGSHDSDNDHHVSQLKRKGNESRRAARDSSDGEKSKSKRHTGKDRRTADSDSSEVEEPKSKQGKSTSKRGESTGKIPRATIPEQKTNLKRKRKHKHSDHRLTSESSDEDEQPHTQQVETTSRKNDKPKGKKRQENKDFGIYSSFKKRLIGPAIWYAIAAEGYLVTQTCAEETRDKAIRAAISMRPTIFPGGPKQYIRDRVSSPVAAMQYSRKFLCSCRSLHSVNNIYVKYC